MKKKIAMIFLMILNLTFFPSSVSAQDQPLACQVDKATGLVWERGQWVPRTFVTQKFILVQKYENTLTVESVAKALFGTDRYARQTSCKTSVTGYISCADGSGASLFFNPKTLKGGMSLLMGSTSENDARDTVTVEVFSCTSF